MFSLIYTVIFYFLVVEFIMFLLLIVPLPGGFKLNYLKWSS
jgi:hypothetical protein